MSGPDVKHWQFFLIGQKLYSGVASGSFDDTTKLSSIAFQNKYKLNPDGIVGNMTIGRAMQLGFDVIADDLEEQAGPNWPSPPSFAPLVGNAARQAIFGKFQFEAAGTTKNPEAIKILGSWESDNVVTVNIPQIIGIKGAPKSGNVRIHKLVAKQFVKMFAQWQEAGLIVHIKSWGGTFEPRFVRGSDKTLSNHSFATALDMNMEWNGLGARPALVGKEGSVRLLVPIANDNGFYWGGHFGSKGNGRQDGMHIEAAVIKKG